MYSEDDKTVDYGGKQNRVKSAGALVPNNESQPTSIVTSVPNPTWASKMLITCH